MANWTIEQVAEWLKKQGFEQFIPNFKDRQIDGIGLGNLSNDTIQQLLYVSDGNEAENQRLVEQFQEKLYQWKRQHNSVRTHRRTERSIGSSSTVTNSTHDSCTKNLTLSTDGIGTKVKFFNNPLFRTRFQQHLLSTDQVECQIRVLETQEIYLTLSGMKENVKTARETITHLFESVRTKIYEDEESDQQMIYWSQHITSDLIVPVIQQIMNHQNIFTLWEKTAMFYGHFKVVYFTHEAFTVSKASIATILSNEIEYIENLVMPNEKSPNLLKNIEEFILNKQDPKLAIIYCKYPYQLELKISLFGRKKLIKRTKKQLQSIITKYTIKKFQLKMNMHQHEYLLDNCPEELKDIEKEYQDDGIKIRIRQKELWSPQYLIEKIKQQINELVFQTGICQFEKIGSAIKLTDEQNQQINQIARRNYCRIKNIDTSTEMKVYSIPYALTQISNTSSSTMAQSKEFSSALTMRKISVLNSSIEIYLTNQSTFIQRDITIISSPAAAMEEGIEYLSDNGYCETKTRGKILFHRWQPAISSDKKLKKSVEEFVSSTLQSVTTCYLNVEKIAFIPTEWENVGMPQQFAECLINEVKQELERRKMNWRILFLFNTKQNDFYKEFSEVLIRFQIEQDGFAQFSCLISTIQIIVSSSLTTNLSKSENEINTYIKENLLANQILTNEIDLQQWDQYTINAFYKYCLSKSVLAKMDLKTNLQIQLIGVASDVEKSLEKYQFTKEIIKQKSSLRIPPPVTPRTSRRQKPNRSNPIHPDGYNIYFSFCQHDQVLCHRISTCLIGEGYSVCQTPSDMSLFQALIDRSDVILIAFSENYPNSTHSMVELNYGKSTRKKLISFVIREDTEEETAWLSSLTIAELFYDLFDTEIEMEFHDDFDLEYDRLLSTLLHHTKPGITGRIYPQPTALPEIHGNNDDYEEAAFGYKSLTLQNVTPEERSARQKAYEEKVKKQFENEKIPDDDVDDLIVSLTIVVDYLEAILRGKNPDTLPSESWQPHDRSLANAYEFLACVKRWLRRSPNVIRGNIAPFTPTGDINDAIFIIHRSLDDKPFERIYEPFDHSPPEKYFSPGGFDPNLYFDHDQSHEYFQKLVESIRPINDIDTTIGENEIVWDEKPVPQGNNDETEKEKPSPWRTEEEMRKIDERDNPNRIWTNNRNAERFIQQKIKNILEFKELCEKSS